MNDWLRRSVRGNITNLLTIDKDGPMKYNLELDLNLVLANLCAVN